MISGKKEVLIIAVLFCLLAYFPFFLHLTSLPIRIWDESRMAISTYEMLKNGNYFVATFNGIPDNWNTKPPLLIWIQLLFSKIFGYNEFAIRLPVAFAAVFTAAILIWFSKKYLKDYWFGMIAMLVLITSTGYINVHSVRTGDYDGLLTLFSTGFVLTFFLFIESRNRRYLHLSMLMLLLAIYTKSIQPLIFIPAILIYLLIQKQLLSILKNKWIYIDAFIVLIIAGVYYFLRNHYTPEYIYRVWNNEMGGRFINAIEDHREPFLFYYNLITGGHFVHWVWFLPIAITCIFLIKDQQLKKLGLYSLLMVIFYWLVVSTARTKLEWYDVPMFPFLAIVVAIFIYIVFNAIRQIDRRVLLKSNLVAFGFLFVVFVTPYATILSKVYLPKERIWDKEIYAISYYLQDALKSNRNIDGQICYIGYNAHLQYYVNVLNDRGSNLQFKDLKELDPGAKVIACQPNVKKLIQSHYNIDVMDQQGLITRYRIISAQKHPL